MHSSDGSRIKDMEAMLGRVESGQVESHEGLPRSSEP